MEPPFLWAKGDSSPTILSFPVCPGLLMRPFLLPLLA